MTTYIKDNINIDNFERYMVSRMISYNKKYLAYVAKDRMTRAINHILYMMDAFDLVSFDDDDCDTLYNAIVIYTDGILLCKDFKIAVENVILNMLKKCG